MFGSCFKTYLRKKKYSNIWIIVKAAINDMISKTEGLQNMTKVYNKPCGRPYNINMRKIMIHIFRFEHKKMARIPETLFIPIFSRHVRIKINIKNYKY